MKVGILTFHRCINYGSYWQARCLVEGLRALGHDAELMDHDAPAIRRAEWRNAFQPRLPIREPRARMQAYALKARACLEAIDRLPQSPRFALDRAQDAGAYDAILVGSDEVWNFRHPWYGFKPIFFGDGLRTGRLASYAASFGNHDAALGVEPDWADKLRRFDAISVRDDNSRALVRDAIGRDPALVLDPCLQFPPPAPAPANEPAPYIAVYGHDFPDWYAAAVRRWADANGRRVLAIGYHVDWADDHRIAAGPEQFSALIAGADAVATNFFHGCVFALHHRRPFTCAPSNYRFNKVRDLVRTLAAERHMVTERTPHETYAALFVTALDPAIAARIATLRTASDAYLAAVLG